MNHSLYTYHFTYLFEDQGANVVPFLVSFPCKSIWLVMLPCGKCRSPRKYAPCIESIPFCEYLSFIAVLSSSHNWCPSKQNHCHEPTIFLISTKLLHAQREHVNIVNIIKQCVLLVSISIYITRYSTYHV